MRIVLAPDSYKGSASAHKVAQAMQRGVLQVYPGADVRLAPIADGGEGTVEALVGTTGGQLRHAEVSGPLGERIDAQWGILGDGVTAVIEMAAASGLTRVPHEQRDPRLSSSYGTGELVCAALDAGLRRFIIGIGGSATNDAGAGMMRALGIRFLDQNARPLPEGGAALAQLSRIDLSGLDPRLQESEITVACDVDNPLCGPRGASAVFGPQKGASAPVVAELDAALAHFAVVAEAATGRAVAKQAGAGAAGGLGAALLFFTKAKLRPGVDIILDAVDFATLVAGASFVITGEGRTDFQTAFGKAPIGVAQRAKRFGIPVFCLSGGLGDGADDVLAQGIDAVMSICDRPMPLEQCIDAVEALIESASARLCRIIRAAQPG